MKKIELLAPAGDLEKLKIAIIYGADAVYFGGQHFSLRAGAGGLSIDEMKEGLSFAHDRGKKCYLTLNIYAHNDDIDPLYEYLHEIKDLPLDGILVSDPGIIMMIKEVIPNMEIHLSTQANMTNSKTAMFWREMGMKRLVLARELSLKEIKEIRENLPDDVELEAFVHGAMCISYSGRCLLSNFMTGRDSNRGACAHPCRYKYVLEEEKRPGEFYPIEEDARGTYIMNSKDLCMIEHIPELVQAGVVSAKIEGRMKSIYYIAAVIMAYRKAIDAYYMNPYSWKVDPAWITELEKASHREFTTGFYFDYPNDAQNYKTSSYIKNYSFTGLVMNYDEKTNMALVEQRNKMVLGDLIEYFGPDGKCFSGHITKMLDYSTGEPISEAPHPKQKILIQVDEPVKEYYMLRKKIEKDEEDNNAI